MSEKHRVVYYLNQFFGELGVDKHADEGFSVSNGPVGPALMLQSLIKDEGEVIATVICGDKYITNKPEEAIAEGLAIIKEFKPDLFIAGPAFNAFSYCMACGSLAAAVEEQLAIPTITAMYPENTAADLFKNKSLIVETGINMADMQSAVTKMAGLAKKILKKEYIGSAQDEGYICRDINNKIYDVIIIGAGPAGLAAGSYAGRAKLDTLIIEKEKDGGQIVITAEIENYPGCIEGETGPSIIGRMSKQAACFGAVRVFDTIEDVELEGKIKEVIGKKNKYYAKTIVLATGAFPRPIGCSGEKGLIGKGVSYCATCDGAFFKDMDVYVVGGGDAAVEEAMYLTKFARKVTIIHRRNELRAAKSIQEKAFRNPKIDFMWDTVINELKGNGILESMVVKNVETNQLTEILASEDDGTFGVFVFIGFVPQTRLFEGKIEMENGYILTDDDMKTNIPGVFAAGDARKKSLRQVVTAAADGAIAAVQVDRYISGI